MLARPTEYHRLSNSMLALGGHPPPASLCIEGRTYRYLQTVKHDFWAMTAFYADESAGHVVYKAGRVAGFLGIPLWLAGRWLVRREVRFHGKLADLPNIPRVLATFGDIAFVREFVPGQPLAANLPIPDGFFDHLQRLIDQLHRRGIAYVDMNKRSNILLGEDGQPHLFDFQISWDRNRSPISGWWLRRFQREDLYHLLKHKRRFRPDELTADEQRISMQPSRLIRLHRTIARPYFLIRRAMFRRMPEALSD
jgi:hypothetical protein